MAAISKLLLAARRALGSADDRDGCELLAANEKPVTDEELPFHFLFGDVQGKPRKIAKRKRELEQLAGEEQP